MANRRVSPSRTWHYQRMQDRGSTGRSESEVRDRERDHVLQVLTLEYETLRAEILMRTSARYQFLGFITAAAAILATGVVGSSSGVTEWLLATLAGVVFIFGLLSFWQLGSDVAHLSARVAKIETRINRLMPSEPGTPALLSWESDHQHRPLFDRWVLGHRFPKRRWSGQPGGSRPSDP
jgi:hypothetical protein